MTTVVMTTLARRIVQALPSLRRYAYALTGDRQLGDRYIEVALATLAEEPWHVREGDDVRCQLYRLLHRVLDALSVHDWDASLTFADEERRTDLTARLQELSLLSRKLVLLTTVERLSLAHAAELVDLPPRVARVVLARARMALAEMPWGPSFPVGRESCLSSRSELALN